MADFRLIIFHLYNGKENNTPWFILDSWNPRSRKNYIEVSDISRSYVDGYDEGIWRSIGRSEGRNTLSLEQDNPVLHEFEHILGLPDRYDKQTNRPYKGWENNIMGDSKNGTVEARNIEELLIDTFKQFDVWRKYHDETKETFIYEINP